MARFKVAIVGAAGFVGVELTRLVLQHPELELSLISSDVDAGRPLAELYPFFAGRTNLVLEPHDAVLKAPQPPSLVFLAVPHTAALEKAALLMQRGSSVIDLSADFRLHDAAAYEQWYEARHTQPALLAEAVYGLPELFRAELQKLALRRAGQGTPALVANPGCYPTATTLAAWPLLASDLLDPTQVVVINALSGVSGAGRSATEKTHFCLANESMNAYGATTHRHTPEIAQVFAAAAGRPVPVQFTPHLVPLNRGMVSTLALRLTEKAAASATLDSVWQLYAKAYEAEPFVQLLPAGEMPKSGNVKYGNYAQVGLAWDATTRMVVVSCALDNLGKGAASQAVQNANIVLGLEETSGLKEQGGVL